jgi:hypothetical protein
MDATSNAGAGDEACPKSIPAGNTSTTATASEGLFHMFKG